MNGREQFMNDRLSEILGRTLTDGLGVKNDTPPTNTDPPSNRSEEILITMHVLQLIMKHILNGGDLFDFLRLRGIDVENIPEEESAPINKNILRYIAKRRTAFSNSAFTQTIVHAQAIIEALMRSRFSHGEEEMPLTSEEETLSGDLAWHTALLFCSLYPSIDTVFYQYAFNLPADRKNLDTPVPDAVPLTDAQKGEIETICNGFFRLIPADNINVEPMDILTRYIAKEYGGKEDEDGEPIVPLSALAQSNRAFLPIARAYRLQGEIGAAGAEGTQIRVSSKGDELVTIYAKISDRDGNPISPSATHTNLCAAFGQIWEENGYQPCVVSVEKIYRTYAGLSNNEHATPQQLTEIEAAIDEMLFMPAEVNFSEQISKQKKIKKKDDIDYKDAHFKGTMLPAQKVKATYNGTTVTAYKIYDMPLFYKYSHATGQIAQVDRKLLSDMSATRKTAGKGRKNRTEAEKATGTMYGGTRVVNLRRYILTAIEDIKRIAKKNKGRPLGAGARTILYADIAAKCGYDITSAQTIRTLRSNVDGYLSELVSSGHISKYEIAREKQKYVGVRIDP